jgi:hypothetical protein
MSIKHKVHDFKGGSVELTLTPRTAIKRFCLECMCGQQAEIQRCTAPLCPLYPFRLGDAHALSARQRATLSEMAKNSTFGKKTGPTMG